MSEGESAVEMQPDSINDVLVREDKHDTEGNGDRQSTSGQSTRALCDGWEVGLANSPEVPTQRRNYNSSPVLSAYYVPDTLAF